MTIAVFFILLLLLSALAGIFGALTGLGGGALLIPLLVLLFHIDIHYAMGAALFAVMATSAGTAIAYMREGYINLRIGMFLEVAASLGAFAGAYITSYLAANWVELIFGIVFIISAYSVLRRQENTEYYEHADPLADKLNLNGSYPSLNGPQEYRVQKVLPSFGIMIVAGILSGLLGIGSGSVKVLAMDQAMRLPYKVSTSTSNFIIGITAAVGAGVYLRHGFVEPTITAPVIIGVLVGALLGARLMPHLPVKPLRIFFSGVIFLLALEMIYRGFGGAL